MDDKRVLENILSFMKRSQLTGEECHAWMEGYQYLQKLLENTKGGPDE